MGDATHYLYGTNNKIFKKQKNQLGPVAVWCRSFGSILSHKGDERWVEHVLTNFVRMQCALD